MSRPTTGKPVGRPAARKPAPRSRTAEPEPFPVRVSALVLSGVGAVLLALAFAVLDWYQDSVGATLVAGTFADLRDVNTLVQLYGLSAPLILRVYFDWLALTLLLLVVAAFAATMISGPFGVAARIVGALAGAAGVIATCWAMQDLSTRVAGRHGFTVFTDARLGLWCALAGYALLGLAAGIGLRRR